MDSDNIWTNTGGKSHIFCAVETFFNNSNECEIVIYGLNLKK